jgi:hypothetical protein
MNPFPAEGVVAEQVPEQAGIPGACSHGEASLVPEFVSDPAAET